MEQNLQKPEPKKSNGLKALGLFVFILFLIPMLTIAAVLLPLPISDKKTVVIPHGSKIQDIAVKLKSEGIEPYPILFRAVTRLLANDSLKAGEYEFSPKQNLIDAVLMMHDGDSIVRMLTIPEGLTSAEILNILRNDETLSGDVTRQPAEGSLLPETYRYTFGDSRSTLLERMQKSSRELINDLWPKRADNLPIKTPQEAIVMASIIEKETGKKPEERARVAGVFYNRLKLNMRLQSDPTVIYAITNGQKSMGRELTHEDLAFSSPYNTYTSDGLPPNPISNPGKASLEAALHPEKNDFLYFVADGTGGHAFAKDLQTHNSNVNRWLCLPPKH